MSLSLVRAENGTIEIINDDGQTRTNRQIKQTNQAKQTDKQAGADITGQLQFRPMLYTLYIDINVRVVKMIHTDNKQQITT